jgi:hypothetical protein
MLELNRRAGVGRWARDVAGIDFAKMTEPPAPPVTVFDWRGA